MLRLFAKLQLLPLLAHITEFSDFQLPRIALYGDSLSITCHALVALQGNNSQGSFWGTKQNALPSLNTAGGQGGVMVLTGLTAGERQLGIGEGGVEGGTGARCPPEMVRADVFIISVTSRVYGE